MTSDVHRRSGSKSNVVHVLGGLGNQLFQYLFGQALERRTGLTTQYDLSSFRTYKLHNGFALEDMFNIRIDRAPDRADRLSTLIGRSRFGRKLAGLAPRAAGLISLASDGGFSLDTMPASNKPRYFVGYWQNQPYTDQELADTIQALSFSSPLVDATRDALQALDPTDPRCAALHIRRGDYLLSGPTGPNYALPYAYFRQAIDELRQHHGIRRFVIFSDEICWAKEAFQGATEEIIFVDKAYSTSAAGDFRLFSAFTVKILSNSTFAWWAALLGPEEGRIVIAPRPWLNPGYRGDHSQHPVLLEGWREISVTHP